MAAFFWFVRCLVVWFREGSVCLVWRSEGGRETGLLGSGSIGKSGGLRDDGSLEREGGGETEVCELRPQQKKPVLYFVFYSA